MTVAELPFDLPPRPVKRETLSVWQAAVLLRKAGHTVSRLSRRSHVIDGRQRTTQELIDMAYAVPVDDDPARPLAVLDLKARRAPDEPKEIGPNAPPINSLTPKPAPEEITSADPLYIPPFLQGAPERLAAKARAERAGSLIA